MSISTTTPRRRPAAGTPAARRRPTPPPGPPPLRSRGPERSERLGRRLQRWRWPILGAAAVFLVISVVWGTGVFGRLSGGGFDTPGSESAQAAERIEGIFGRQDADVAIVYASESLTVGDPAFRTEVEQTLAGIPAKELAQATTLWSANGSPALASADGRQTLVLLQLTGADEEGQEAAYRRIADLLVADGLETYRGGQLPYLHRGQRSDRARPVARRDVVGADPAGAARPRVRQPSPPPACRWPSASSPSSARSPP